MESREDAPIETPGNGGLPAQGPYWAAVVGLVLLVGIAGFALVRRQRERPPAPAPVAAEAESASGGGTRIVATAPEALSPEAQIAAERYRCVCGCDDPLSVCTCTNTPGSRDMKEHLQSLVSAGLSPREIDAGMVEKYGPRVLIEKTDGSPEPR